MVVSLIRVSDGAQLASRVVGGGADTHALDATYDVSFGVPTSSTPVTVNATFVGGRVIAGALLSSLSLLTPSQWYDTTAMSPRVVVVRDAPVPVSVAVTPAAGFVAIGQRVAFTVALLAPGTIPYSSGVFACMHCDDASRLAMLERLSNVKACNWRSWLQRYRCSLEATSPSTAWMCLTASSAWGWCTPFPTPRALATVTWRCWRVP